ncbi:sll0787 family AIR synthase-like protein [Synechococcus sp. CS-1325]|uniref:sll0787 family AIR synthase-like protein n=1 Tax=Synechococcus sp. CS-1325 TaxID=2847979 RepID=UPI000DB482E5|nr:sll0787 family AIR synthase-like protein [Synechococcus sp. CS-1325]MCT0199577.1 sll0787 family AIR synthase-like protein [Synechococcus sp. CS-1325]PZV02774.1 MAG: sll0787 family AIR synthase-like protein [Cyanobium sp.]
MSLTPLEELAARLQRLPGLTGKVDIQHPASVFPHQPFPQLGPAAALGDDAALLPPQSGALLLACEGLHPGLVERDPWFAGWCGVLVNLSDIAAMGGTPLAVVNSLWSRGGEPAEQLLSGMRAASETFAVPVVGGHTNLQSPYEALSVAVLGVAPGPILSARSARPGDTCQLLIHCQGGTMRRPDPFWDAATAEDPARLRAQLALLPLIAAEGLAHAAKDISMGGLIGTAAMLCEAAGCGLVLDLDAIKPPEGVELEEWITCFPSFGFLLASAPDQGQALRAVLEPHPELLCHPIGMFQEGQALELMRGDERVIVRTAATALTGFGALS